MEKTNKIVFITGNFPYGGASANLLRNLAIGLKECGNSIKVLIPAGFLYGQTKNSCRKGKIEGVCYRYLCFRNHPVNPLLKIVSSVCGISVLFFCLLKKSLKREMDFVISYNTTLFKSILLLLIKKMTKTRLVYILADFYRPPEKKWSLGYIKLQAFNFSLNYLVKYADGFIVLSTYLRDLITRKTEGKKRIALMPNVIDPGKFTIAEEKLFKTDKLTIGYTGTEVVKDGVLDLIKSFVLVNKTYPDTHLLIIGDNPSGKSFLPALKKLAAELGMESSITFKGLVNHEEIPGLLQSCQILALVRPHGLFAEAGFPTKLGEYFSCRKPVLLTRVGDAREYFKDNKAALLVDPENHDDIAAGLMKIISDKKFSENLALNGYEWMLKHLDRAQVAVRIDAFLKELLVHEAIAEQ